MLGSEDVGGGFGVGGPGSGLDPQECSWRQINGHTVSWLMWGDFPELKLICFQHPRLFHHHIYNSFHVFPILALNLLPTHQKPQSQMLPFLIFCIFFASGVLFFVVKPHRLSNQHLSERTSFQLMAHCKKATVGFKHPDCRGSHKVGRCSWHWICTQICMSCKRRFLQGGQNG